MGAPIYFMSYMVVVFFITLNLMIAIIIDGYEEAKQTISGEDDQDLLFIHDCLRSLALKFTARIKKFFNLKKLNRLRKSISKISPENPKFSKTRVSLRSKCKKLRKRIFMKQN